MPPETPLPLDAVVGSGATFFGRPIRRIVAVLLDGRRVALDLPLPAAGALTQTEARVLAVVQESPTALTRKTIASRMGRSDATGKLGRVIRDLVAGGRLIETGGMVTDDAKKLIGAG